jgi:uncharacterized repeat protein (TIGR03833 family)
LARYCKEGMITLNGQNRKDIKPGLEVEIVTKENQRSGKRTRGIIKDILTNSAYHPHGIKVRLETGEVGRVQEIVVGMDEKSEGGRK